MNSKNRSYMKPVLLMSLFIISFTNMLMASHERGSVRLTGTNVFTGNVLCMQDNKYPAIATMAGISTWGFYDASFKNKLVLGIDRYSTTVNGDFEATIDVKITSTLPLALGGTTSSILKTLKVSYEGVNDHTSATPHNSSDEQNYVFSNGYAVSVEILSVSVTTSGGTSSTMPDNVYLQMETDAERFYELQQASPFANSSDVTINYLPLSDEFEISWTRIEGAEQYDLEWLWLDGEKNVFWNSTPEIDFRNNSTRITTSQQSYRISNIFEYGQVFFRIRGVGKSGLVPNTYDKTAYTPWSWQDLTTIPSGIITSVYSVPPGYGGTDYLYYVTIDGVTAANNGQVPILHEQAKNWQYKATYAEEGKKKEVISYFDGSLRSRQSVTKNNSDNNAIVGETYYDYNGRAAVQALPVPVADATIKFYQYNVSGKSGFNFDVNTQLTYHKSLFDEDDAASQSSVCAVVSTGLDPNYGASNYYSPNNANQQWAQGYVPDAELFPISQTEYTNDNTGRIAKQGGVGKTHQLGSGHETKYFYGSPEQVELDRLFGSEVGYNKHYKKNMVVDANGQVSISYIDQEGRTVATALSGQSPANLEALTKNATPLYTAPAPENLVIADLLNKADTGDVDTNTDNNERVGDELSFSKKILVPTASTYTVSYDLRGTGYTYNCLGNACYDCVYDLEINIYDNCLNNPAGFTKITRTLGNIVKPVTEGASPTSSYTLDTQCNQEVHFSTSQLSSSDNDLLVNLEQGEYTIVKTLKINKDALSFYLNDYLQSNCVKTVEDFKSGLSADTSGCSLTCDECLAALGPQAAYVAALKGSNEDWLREYQICKEPCEYVSICDAEYITMLADVSPGGQYGDWEDNNGSCDPSLYDLSVFNESNLLPKAKKYNGGGYDMEVPDWKHPKYRNSSASSSGFTGKYTDDDGQVSVVYVTQTGTTTYNPPVISGVTPGPVPGSSTQFTVEPQELANVADFIANWKNSWAKSLVFYHPEYPYYDWCLKNSTESIASPYAVSLTSGTVVTTNTIATSDHYDSLLLVTDDVASISSLQLNKFTNCLANDPYWTTNGFYYNNATYPSYTPLSITPQLSASPATAPWNGLYKTATIRYTNYQSSGVSLPVFAALITTSCSIQYGQNISSQLTCLNSGYSITSGMTAEQIINILPTALLKNKYWDSYRMMYLSMKQELQQESAESYVMNSAKYRGCNDCIGDASFDPYALTVPFTQYYQFGPFSAFPGAGFTTSFYDQWFSPTNSINQPQYCNLFMGQLYTSKIKRFPNAKAATDLGNNMAAGDPGASIYASTGLCPNAFYFQNFLNSLGTANQLTSTTLNLSAIPEFNKDLYTVVNGGTVPPTFSPAGWTASSSAYVLNASMKIGTNPSCALTLNFPAGYPFNFSNTGNGGTYAFLKLYHLVPGTTSGGLSNFTLQADVTLTAGSSTYTTVTLTGSTCIPLTGCSFTPPCEPTTTAISLQKLLNVVAATGNMCSSSISMSDPTIQPYFLNTFAPLLGAGNWQWSVNGTVPNFVIKDAGGISSNSLTISFATSPCLSGSYSSFYNITGSNAGSNSFEIGVKVITSGTAVTTNSNTGTVFLNGQPLKMGICGYDNTKCATVPHQIREELEAFLVNTGTRPVLQSASANLTTNSNFGFNLRNQLAGNYQTGSAVSTNTVFYYWQNTTPAASTNTLLTGAFYASTLTPAPGSAPANACDFSLQFSPSATVTAGDNLSNPTAYTLSNFVLANGPTVNNSVYDFSVTATFGVRSYTLVGNSGCFGMRACGECKSPNAVVSQTATSCQVNDFECSSNFRFDLIHNNNNYHMTDGGTPCSSTETVDNYTRYYQTQNAVFTNVVLGTYTVQASYNSYAGSSSLFFLKNPDLSISYIQDFECLNTCDMAKISFKMHDVHALVNNPSNPYLFTATGPLVHYNFTVKIDGSPLTFVSSAPSSSTGWTEYVYGYYPSTVPYDIHTLEINLPPDTNFVHIPGYPLSPVYNFIGIDDIKSVCGNTESLPCVDNISFEPFPEVEYEDPCVQYALDAMENEAQELYNAYIDSMKTAFVQGYVQKCMGDAVENLQMQYHNGDYHYTLYYYDQAGNLVRTVPPEGVAVETNAGNLALIAKDRKDKLDYASKHYYTAHNLQTTYTYNSLNQLVKQETPDGGISYFWYDALGRLVASRNDKQVDKWVQVGDPVYSYTRYDYLGRIAEVGEMITKYDFLNLQSSNPALLRDILNPVGNDYPYNITAVSNRTEVTSTYYGDDDTFTPLVAGSELTAGSQEYLRSRVASVTIEDVNDGDPTTYNHGTHYSYDVHGNVKELVQDNPAMDIGIGSIGQRYKKTNYSYDLISGKVNEVAYQPGKRDMFKHRYEYDADNRITSVFTSKDDVIWDRDAKYFYYLHGPMARVETGHHKVQGTDYAYTLHGWIKGVNSNILEAKNDIGKDANNWNTINSYNARDVFGYSLTYYDVNTGARDYMAINGISSNVGDNFIADVYLGGLTLTPDLFNGNIRQMVTSYLDASAPGKSYDLSALLKDFTYDQLNRIKTATANDNFKPVNIWGNPGSLLYKENFTYDQNGNILKVERNGNQTASLAMDDLTYSYIANTNKLDHVDDAVSGDPYSGDISSQSSGNYQYDAIGNLVSDVAEDIATIDWTVYGKIKQITKGSGTKITFNYDASGNRISKTVIDAGTGILLITYYVRDAQGNTMAVYEIADNEDLFLKEHHIYGSSRLGLRMHHDEMARLPDTTHFYNRELGFKNYELSNHLGNVIATISDRKIGVTSSNPTTILSEQFNVSSSINSWTNWGLSTPVTLSWLPSGELNVMSSTTHKNATLLLPVVPGVQYNLQFNTNITSAISPNAILFNSTFTFVDTQPLASTNSFSFIAPVGPMYLEIYESDPGSGTFDVSIDNVELTAVAGALVDHFTAEVMNATDYYAFGSPMPGRNFNSNSTRYGFNGKEKDDEINVSGGSYDFGNRLYDSRLGKWWSIDKLSSKYPFQSPYSFALNNPIYFVDPDGNVVIPGNELVTAAITAKLNTTFSGELEKYRKNFVLETVKYKVGDKEIEVQAFVFKPSTTTAEGATDIFQVNKAIRDSKLSTKDKLMALAYANVINDPDGLIVASLDAVGNQKYNMGNPINPGDGGIGADAEGDVRTNQTSNEYLTGSVDGAESEKMHGDARGLKASVLKSRDAKTGTVAGVSMSTSASGSLIDEGITEFQDMSPAIKSQVYVKDAAGGKQSLNRSGDIITTPKK